MGRKDVVALWGGVPSHAGPNARRKQANGNVSQPFHRPEAW